MLTYGARFIGVTLALVVLIAGCSKNESSPTEIQPSSPTLPSIIFKGPGSSGSDAGLNLIRSYVANADLFAVALAPLAATTPVQSGSTWTWSYVNKTLTLVLTATKQSDGSYLWRLVFNGVDPNDGTTYDHWLGVEGTTSADGKTGSGKNYVRNKTVVANEFNWTTANNVLTGTVKSYFNGIVVGQTVVVNNPDNSGEVRVSIGSILIYKAIWQANGSGQWWSYDSNGVQTGTGTWT